jgi:hypothetical protein
MKKKPKKKKKKTLENQFLVDGGCIKNVIYLIVEYEGNKIFKSTLVSQLNENPFFLKIG